LTAILAALTGVDPIIPIATAAAIPLTLIIFRICAFVLGCLLSMFPWLIKDVL
jgi:hypothetical protein